MNASPHSPHVEKAFSQNITITTIPWPAMSSNLTPLGHIWDFDERCKQTGDPPVQNMIVWKLQCTKLGNHYPWSVLEYSLVALRKWFGLSSGHVLDTLSTYVRLWYCLQEITNSVFDSNYPHCFSMDRFSIILSKQQLQYIILCYGMAVTMFWKRMAILYCP